MESEKAALVKSDSGAPSETRYGGTSSNDVALVISGDEVRVKLS